MRRRKHRHKESFSVLLISNTGQNARHYHVGASCLRLLAVLALCVCAAFGWMAYRYLGADRTTANYVNASEVTRESELLDKVVEQEKSIQLLKEENEALDRRLEELTTENKALLAAAKTGKAGGAEEEEFSADSAYPSRYPYSEAGEVFQKFSESAPYVSINTKENGSIVAAGDGTVTYIGADGDYPLVIEIDHGNGYRTRYMLPQAAETLCKAGDRVRTGDALAAVGGDNQRLDYQVFQEGKAIDPLIVFEAKG